MPKGMKVHIRDLSEFHSQSTKVDDVIERGRVRARPRAPLAIEKIDGYQNSNTPIRNPFV